MSEPKCVVNVHGTGTESVVHICTAPRTIWELAAEAQAQVSRWPRWKRVAADAALVTRLPKSYYDAEECKREELLNGK